MFRVHLFGEFQLHDARGQPLRLMTRKTQWLLAYLLLNPEPQSREHLADLFWPDAEPLKAATSLRQALRAVRSALELEEVSQGTPLRTERGIVQFNVHSAHWIDAAEFRKLCKESEKLSGDEQARCLREAIALYRGELLEGCYDDWCLEARDYFRELYLKALQKLIFYHRQRKEYASAIGYAKQLLAQSPLQEDIHRELMHLYYAVGDRNAALAQFRECERVLQEKLNVEPLPETKMLYHQIEERASTGHLEELAVQARETIRRYPELGAPFVGRAQELQKLFLTWDEVNQGKGRAAFVAGEAGVGKSRLAHEFLSYTSQKGALVLSGRCYEIEGRVLYQALVDALRQSLPQISSELINRISTLWLGEVAKLVPELCDRVPGLRPSAALLSPEQERNRLFEGLLQFFLGLSQQQPLVIFIDDLQWADESTLQFMHYLARRLPEKKILLIGTYRVEEVNEEHLLREMLQQLTRDQLILQMNLAPLETEEIEKLVEEMLNAKDLKELGKSVYQESKGVPFFAVELVKSFIEAMALTLDEQGHWKMEREKLARDYVPATVRALVETRLRRVSRPSRQLLDLAAVTGRAFTTELLTQCLGRQAEDVFDRLEELLRAHVIVEEQDRYNFRHDVIREVVYSGLVPEQRRKILHKNVGETLEKTHAERLDELAGELAHHFLQAEVWSKAMEYSLQAGEAARKAYANQEAISYLRQTAELAQQVDNKEALRKAYANLGHVYVFCGRVDEGLEYCRKALNLIKEPHARARIHEIMATGHNYKREHEKALSCCEQAIKELGEEDTSLEMAKICDCAALMLSQLRRLEEAIQHCKRALHILEKMEQHSTLAMVLAHLGVAYRYQEDFEHAIEYLLRAAKAAEKSGDLNAKAEVYYTVGFTYCAKGDIPHANEFLKKALSMYEQIGDFSVMIWTYQLLCLACIQSSDLDQAVEYTQKVLEMATQHQRVREIASAHSCLACLYLARDLKRQAEKHFAKALEIAGSDGSLYIEIATNFVLLKHFDDALEWLSKGLPYMTSDHIANAKSYIYLKPLRNHSRFKLLFENR